MNNEDTNEHSSKMDHGFIWYLFVRLDIQYWLTCIVCTKFRWQKNHLDQYAWKQVFLDQDHTKTVTIDGTTWESLILIPLHQWALMGLSRGDMSRLCDPREKKGWEMARPSAQCQCQAHNVVMSQTCNVSVSLLACSCDPLRQMGVALKPHLSVRLSGIIWFHSQFTPSQVLSDFTPGQIDEVVLSHGL